MARMIPEFIARPESPLVVTEGLVLLPQDKLGEVLRCPNILRHPFRAASWAIRMLFGLFSLTLLLAVIAAIPLVNILALGYLLEVEGRMGRTGRVRYAFPLLEIAPRFGAIVVGLAGWLLPVWGLTLVLADYRLVAATSDATMSLAWIHRVTVVLVTGHLLLALARGGSPGCFVRPLKNVVWLIGELRRGGYFERAEHHVRTFVSEMRIGHHFWLGLRGFVGGLAWLVIPCGLFGVYSRAENIGQLLATLVGGLSLVLVLSWVPFLQARLATENRMAAMFELRAVRGLFCRSPMCWFIVILVTSALSLPLYLFKIYLLPSDAMWMTTLVFIVTIYPARLMTGWAYHRATTRIRRSFWMWHWFWRLAMLPLLSFYVFLLFFTPLFSEHGKRVLFEHHLLLLPVPF
ncbi:MAG: hypothetical protein VYA62_11685 [Planctomycetota bacterium]|nr:hypothetical protein [Planctomycetota bacterium]